MTKIKLKKNSKTNSNFTKMTAVAVTVAVCFVCRLLFSSTHWNAMKIPADEYQGRRNIDRVTERMSNFISSDGR